MLKTLKNLMDSIKGRYTLQDNTVVTDKVLIDYINEGIKIVEMNIHKFNRENEYFRSNQTINIVKDKANYPLPSNIFAGTILGIVDSKNYIIPYIKEPFSFMTNTNSLDNPYQGTRGWYTNNISPPASAQDAEASGVFTTSEINFIPTPTSDEDVKMVFIRKANEMVSLNSVCDIPEFEYYIINYAIMNIAMMEKSNNIEYYVNQNNQYNALLEVTLKPKNKTGDNELVADDSILTDQIVRDYSLGGVIT